MSLPSTDTILAKVDSARRRLVLGRFGKTLAITMFAALLISTIAVAAMAVVPLATLTSAFGISQNESGTNVQPAQWIAAWTIGSLTLALIAAAVDAWWHAPSRADVAAEIDNRFGLRERLSSSLAVTTSNTPTGTSAASSRFADALVDDASSRASSLNIAEKFPLRAGRAAWLPLSIIPILAAMIMVVEPASINGDAIASNVDSAEVRQVKAVAAELKKRIAEQRRASEAKGLKEAQELFQNMERQLENITKSDSLNRKDALIQLNEIKDQIQERKDRIGSPDQLRRTLSQMKGLDGGPAEKIADQIQKGDFANAAEEIRKLAQKVKDGKMGEKEVKKLAEQTKKLAEQMKDAVKQHEQKKEQLREQIEQAKREGRTEDAAKMQQKLNDAEAADAQMQQMQQMAKAMQNAAEAMQQGDSKAAADAMQEMSEQLGEMQAAMEELEDLQDALNDLSQSKDQMNCNSCNGEGCQQCMGSGFGNEGRPGFGMGEGNGKGDRPEEETDTNSYDTQVRGDVKRGRAVIAGFADGPNRKGLTREAIRNVIESSISEEGDPLEDQVLPRDEREQTRQYFDRLREGV
ncbi:putative transcriptional regulator [Rhodopirellula rubra]|uniref:Putative transcriptional regulator n=1 Tax=Aporhodopirellula rubra TaxID=980271 RepID=A0A7W5E6P8_9BACT|nr:hypothetical protein [Aporhodopirellula rubra]MBB3210583.1 putative transcriptional regulator [Aporhodopirellula rubra]